MTTRQQHEHPADETLASFALGHLDDEEASRVADHVGACERCQAALRAVPNDSFLSLLRSRCSTPVPRPEHLGATAEAFEESTPAELLNHERYRVVRRLGSGGMGVVYKAEHRLMDRAVALKVINRELTARPDVAERFRAEVRAQAKLSHPNVVAALDAEQAGELHFFAMEFVEGTDLAWLVDRDGPLPVEKACEYARQAALGLQHAHERGLIHRDVKPRNLMVTPQGQVKVLDFGLARLATAADGGLTELGQGLGTPDYVAPEQIRDAHAVDGRADVYSLGCTLYFLLTGRPPFPDGSPAQKIAGHLERQPESLRRLRPELPAALVTVVERMMAKEPARRHQTAADAAAALEPFCRPQQAGQRRGRKLWWATAALLLVGIATAGVVVLRMETAHGTLVIETDDDDVQIVVKQRGKVVEIIDPKKKRTVRLKTGGYELELSENGKPLELSSNEFTLKRDGEEIVRVKRTPKVARKDEKTEVVPKKEKKEPVADDPKVLTVSQKAEDGGRFRTISEALEKVEPGMTVRVLDDAVYKEAVTLSQTSKHAGLTLEAPRRATLCAKDGAKNLIEISGVKGVTVRGFRLRNEGSASALVYVHGHCPAALLENLDLDAERRCNGMEIGRAEVAPDEPPIMVRHCHFRRTRFGVGIEGSWNYTIPVQTSRISVRLNTFEDCAQAIHLTGKVNRVQVVGNQMWGGTLSGIQLENFLPGAGDVLIANNTVFETASAFRLWDTAAKGKNVRLCNNLFLGRPQEADLVFVDSGGDPQRHRGFGDGKSVTAVWGMDHNWRELKSDKGWHKGWIHVAAADRWLPRIDILSRKPGERDFLRPAKASPLAKEGAGGQDPPLPTYVGAVPPEGAEAWDWDRTWRAFAK